MATYWACHLVQLTVTAIGDALGIVDGATLGVADGTAFGLTLGTTADDTAFGDTLGIEDGAMIGATDGSELGKFIFLWHCTAFHKIYVNVW